MTEWKSLPLVGLCVIAKQESHIIMEMLVSVVPFINYYTFVDTGSTDGTQDIVKKFMDENKIPGQVYQYTWDTEKRGRFDFGYNRTLAFNLCKNKCRYAFVMDADDYLIVSKKESAPKCLISDADMEQEHDAFQLMTCLVMGSLGPAKHPLYYPRIHLLRTDRPWKYRYGFHEEAFLNVSISAQDELDYKMAAISHSSHYGKRPILFSDSSVALGLRSAGDRSKDIEKYKNDALQLHQMSEQDPNNARILYFKGQALYGNNDFENAKKAYEKFIEVTGKVHDKIPNYNFGFHARRQLAMCAIGLKQPSEIVIEYYKKAWEFFKNRAEPASQIMALLNQSSEAYEHVSHMISHISYHPSMMFCDKPLHDWKVYAQYIDVCTAAKKYKEAIKYICFLLKNKRLDGEESKDKLVQQLRNRMANCLKKSNETDIVEQGFYQEKKRVKVLTNWLSEEDSFKYVLKMSQNGQGKWNNIQIVPPTEPFDFSVVLNHPKVDAKFNQSRAVLMKMEPASTRQKWEKGLDKEKWYNILDRNNIEWHLNKTWKQLNNEPIIKSTKLDKILSTVTSGYAFLEGHKKRLAFVALLDKELGSTGFHLYGRDKMDIKSYIGALPRGQKEDGLYPYKYTFAAENTLECGYFTEKIADAILSECLCFYWGCPDIDRFIDERAFIRIDLDKPEEAIIMINDAIENNEWDKRISFIRDAKNKILNELQFFPTLERLLRESKKCIMPPFYCISLASRPDRRKRMENRFKSQGLLEKVTFLDATPVGDKLIDFYGEDMPRGLKSFSSGFKLNYDAVYGCYASHIRALKMFVQSDHQEAIIIEDDVMFRDTFSSDFQTVYENIPDDAPLVQLCYIVTAWNMAWAGKDKTRNNLYKMKADSTWGTQMYLIRREYAIQCIEKYDKPLKNFTEVMIEARTSEMITRTGDGYLVYPILAIEESVLEYGKQSNLRQDSNQGNRFASWGIDNFMLGESCLKKPEGSTSEQQP